MTHSSVWHDPCDITHSHVSRYRFFSVLHAPFICVTWLIDVVCCDASWIQVTSLCSNAHSYVWHDSILSVWNDVSIRRVLMLRGYRSLLFLCSIFIFYVKHDTFVSVLYVSFICVTWLIHPCDMTQSYVWHDSFLRVTCLVHKCDVTHS